MFDDADLGSHMKRNLEFDQPQTSPAGTLRSVQVDNALNSRVAGKLLPVCFWIFFLVAILSSMIADALHMSNEGASLESLLRLTRAGLTGAFTVLLATTYLIRLRATEKAVGFRERIFPMLVFLASIVGVGLLQSRPGLPSVYLAGAGLVLAPLGLCVSIWSLWHLRGSFSILAEARRTVASGPYTYVRHPLYLGEILTMLGLCLLIGTASALLFWAVISALQLLRARFEEEKLSRALSDYEAYRRKTPFVVPGFLIRSQ